MATPDPVRCPACGDVGSRPDRRGWCAACRAGILPRAQRWGWACAAAAAVLFVAATVLLGIEADRFLIAWLAAMGFLCFAAFKIGRRVAFEAIQFQTTRGGKGTGD